MAIIVNTNRALLTKNLKPGEPNGRHRDVSLVANNGTRNYGDLVGGLEGCNGNVRFDERRDDFNVMQVMGRRVVAVAERFDRDEKKYNISWTAHEWRQRLQLVCVGF